MKIIKKFILLIILIIMVYYQDDIKKEINHLFIKSYSLTDIPEYSKDKYIYLNNNEPNFSEDLYTTNSFESYSDLDILGRCGVAFANLGIEIMPTKEREYIGMIKPSGWQWTKYDFIDGKYLYNRCHLIAFQLAGENANPKNLITCTREMNSKTMLEFENKVANYIRKTKNHVLYRVTPIFRDDNLIATGIEMEAESIEDNGKGIKFHVFIYNVQDGVTINYLDGESSLSS